MVISGERTKIEAAVLAGKNRGFKRIIPLNVAGAYHSRLMEPARVAFEAYLEGVTFKSPQLTVFTNVTGEAVTNDASIKAMLVAQIVSTVEWVKCMESAKQAGVTEFIECGPGGVLTGLARRIDSALSVRAVAEWDEIALG
jgi:[acyl-carrier-protein] S-malonyltransferase